MEVERTKLADLVAWIMWLVVHIFDLIGFRNRLLVVLQWAWSYLTFRRGARLIVSKQWRLYATGEEQFPSAVRPT